MDKLDAAFEFNREALNLRASREEVLSSNIANADTPGYQARDMDFSSTLAKTLASHGVSTGLSQNSLAMTPPSSGTPIGDADVILSTDAAGQIGSAATVDGGVQGYGSLKYRAPVQSSADNNTVDLDVERVAFADNTLHYESVLDHASGQVKTMLAALSTGT